PPPPSRRDDAPVYGLAAAMDERALVPFDRDGFGRGPGLGLERDLVRVGRQSVMRRPVERGEGLELVERALLLEHLEVALDRDRRVEEAGNAGDVELLRDRMGRRIGAEEEARIARNGGLPEREPVALALQHRHAIEVGLDPV